MGRRFAAVAALVVAVAAWKVWPHGGDMAEARELKPRVREGRIPTTVVSVVRAAAIDIEVDPDVEIEDEVPDEPTVPIEEYVSWQTKVDALDARCMKAGLGAMHGYVDDADNGELLAGVTVIVASPVLQTPQAAITDEHGYFEIEGLPRGLYLVTYYYLDVTVERPDVHVYGALGIPVAMSLQQRTTPEPPIVITLDEEWDAPSITGRESMNNTYYVDEIDTTSLTFGDDE